MPSDVDPSRHNVPSPAALAGVGGGVELAPGVFVPESALRLQFARSGGPGGQNVNKVNTKAEVWLRIDALTSVLTDRAMARLRTLAGRRLTDAGEIHIAAETSRSQLANRADAMERLRELLVAAMHEPRPRRKTKPSKAAKRRRLESKKRRSETKSNRRAGGESW